jgi:hypothetical protein
MRTSCCIVYFPLAQWRMPAVGSVNLRSSYSDGSTTVRLGSVSRSFETWPAGISDVLIAYWRLEPPLVSVVSFGQSRGRDVWV